MNMTLNDYRRHTTADRLRKATVTEMGTGNVLWFDFGRGRAWRTAFMLKTS